MWPSDQYLFFVALGKKGAHPCLTRSLHISVEVRKWDDLMPTGYHTFKAVGPVEVKNKNTSTWDGTARKQTPDIVKQLEKFSHGYGGPGQ